VAIPQAQDDERCNYRPRAPARTPLHRLVRDHFATFLDLRSAGEGGGLPLHVIQAFEDYLRCGILAHGFARLHCRECHQDRLLPFSCKGRICPSCNARRMHDTAAHLVDRVLPPAPYRQWVLSLPRRVRYLLVTRPELVNHVLQVFQRTLFNWQRHRARITGLTAPRPGSVTFIQRFGDALNLHLHFHSVLPDGVFCVGDEGSDVSFHSQQPPTLDELDELVRKLQLRINRKLVQLDAFEPQLEDETDTERREMAEAIAEKLVAFNDNDELPERHGLSAFFRGYSLHAGVTKGPRVTGLTSRSAPVAWTGPRSSSVSSNMM